MKLDANVCYLTGEVRKIIPKEKSVHVIVKSLRSVFEVDGKQEYRYNSLKCIARGATSEYIKGGGIEEGCRVEVFGKIREDKWIGEDNKELRSIKIMIERIIRQYSEGGKTNKEVENEAEAEE